MICAFHFTMPRQVTILIHQLHLWLKPLPGKNSWNVLPWSASPYDLRKSLCDVSCRRTCCCLSGKIHICRIANSKNCLIYKMKSTMAREPCCWRWGNKRHSIFHWNTWERNNNRTRVTSIEIGYDHLFWSHFSDRKLVFGNFSIESSTSKVTHWHSLDILKLRIRHDVIWTTSHKKSETFWFCLLIPSRLEKHLKRQVYLFNKVACHDFAA